MAVSRIQSFLDQLSKNKNVKNVVGEFNRLGIEVRKRSVDLNQRLSKEGEKALKQAHAKVQDALKSVTAAQTQLDKEVDAAVKKIRKSAEQMESGLEFYRKRAIEQKNRIEKMIRAKAKTTRKKTTKKATKKKVRATRKKA